MKVIHMCGRVTSKGFICVVVWHQNDLYVWSCDTKAIHMCGRVKRLIHMCNASCRTYEWVTSHIWTSHVARMDDVRHTYEWVMSHIWMSHVTHMHESCHTYEWVTWHTEMCHVAHLNQSCHTSDRVIWMRIAAETGGSFCTIIYLVIGGFGPHGFCTVSFHISTQKKHQSLLIPICRSIRSEWYKSNHRGT